MDADKELLDKVCAAIDKRNFFASILLRDSFDDWNLVRECGEFLVRIDPEDVLGYALQARAHRHLGNRDLAVAELRECQMRSAKMVPAEAEVMLPLIEKEQGLLSAEA